MPGVVVGLWIAFIILILATYVSWVATRLDRLHARIETAGASLDAQLVRRAGVAAELAAHTERARRLPLVTTRDLSAAALTALTYGESAPPLAGDREGVENDLSRALRRSLDELGERATLPDDTTERLVGELSSAVTRVSLARRFYNGAVDDTRVLRGTRLVRWLRLAGHASAPAYFEIDEALPEADHSPAPAPVDEPLPVPGEPVPGDPSAR